MKEIGYIQLGHNGNIICPYCGSDYAHQREVEVYHRKEDREGIKVKITPYIDSNDAKVEVERAYEGVYRNPSSRRQGVLIGVTCESCSKHFYIGIAQDKGYTLLRCFEDNIDDILEDDIK